MAVSLGIILSVCGILIFAVVKLFSQAWTLVEEISLDGRLSDIINTLSMPFMKIFDLFPKEFEERILDAFGSLLKSFFSLIGRFLTTVGGEIPRVLFLLLISVIATVYFSVDLENINFFFKSILPSKIVTIMVQFKEKSAKIVVKYVKAYFLIMLITFAVIFFGLTVLKIRYALLLAVIIALLDMLPVLGVGVLLVPWSLWAFASGDSRLGIGLLILYVVSIVTRQIAEPKILGKNLGINPLLTLVLMYLGLTLFGVGGLVFMPIISVILLNGTIGAFDKNHSAKIDE